MDKPKRCSPVIAISDKRNEKEINFGSVAVGSASDTKISMNCQSGGNSFITYSVTEPFLLGDGSRERSWYFDGSSMIGIDHFALVRFSPDRPGRVTGTMTFRSSDGTQIKFGVQRAETVTVRLVGEGVA